MDKEIIKSELHQELTDFVSTHPGMSFKFGYDKARECYVVSYTVVGLSDSDKSWNDLLNLEERLLDLYGNNVPLFCEDESLFRIPAEAEFIPCVPSNNKRIAEPVSPIRKWEPVSSSYFRLVP